MAGPCEGGEEKDEVIEDAKVTFDSSGKTGRNHNDNKVTTGGMWGQFKRTDFHITGFFWEFLVPSRVLRGRDLPNLLSFTASWMLFEQERDSAPSFCKERKAHHCVSHC